MILIKKKNEKIVETLIKLVGILSIMPVFFIIGYIIYKGIPAISWDFIMDMPKDGMRAGGIYPAIIGTLLQT